jgi:hypothetical protein
MLFGQEATFTVKVNTDSVLIGNYIAVTFSIQNGKTDNFVAPTFSDFNIVGGPSQSSSISIINGVSTQSMSYTYYLEPKEEGIFYIEPSSVEIDGEFLETAPVEIKVFPNPEGIIQSPEQQKSRTFDSLFDDPFFSHPFFERTDPQKPKAKAKPKKKRKYYKI